MSNIPIGGWEGRPLGELVEFLDRLRVPIKESDRKNRAGPFPYYGANGQVGWIDGYIFDEPLILLAEDGGFFGSKDHSIAYKVEGKCWVNNHAHVLRPTPSIIDLDYLHWFLSFLDVRPFLSGSTRAKLTQSDACRVTVTFPRDLFLQRKIADAIDRVDDLKRRRDQANQLTGRVVQSVLRKMFGGNGFPEEEIGIYVVKTETRNPRQEPDEYFKYVDISSVDNETGTVKGIKDIKGSDAPSRARKVIRKGDVIVSTVRPNLNATALVPPELDNQICSTGFCVLRVKQFLDPKYLYACTRRSEFVSYLSTRMKGASYPAVTDDDVMKARIPVPPIEMQREFGRILESATMLADSQRNSRKEIGQLFFSLMHKAFRGDLAIRDDSRKTFGPQDATHSEPKTPDDYSGSKTG